MRKRILLRGRPNTRRLHTEQVLVDLFGFVALLRPLICGA